ncbi:MAG: RecQ family ATP-dependent DNA helicase [Duncaniella sp.]|nr:RecQ family ATP-dependent DNA helicase [Muribaculum sp.]MCM1255912.1 RecQ family ATP-dependent DNA helicase [Duncaniella sp.]
MTPVEVLRKYWGYDSFRPLQLDIIESVLQGSDTLGLLPTGGGKSITFQVPAMILPGLTLVVTPLISLMKDQVDNLRDHGIRAVYFHAALSRREVDLGLTRCRIGKAKIVYISPERLQNERFIAELRTLKISLIVVDEAHCISQWGYDFRPSYLKIARLRELTGENVPVLALTASATPDVAADIMGKLNFKNGKVFTKSFTRRNLSYVVRYADFKDNTLLKVLRGTHGCSIVYVRSRKRTREIAEMLNREGISADFYHAGLQPEDKDEKQNRWKSDQVRVMVATNAFGMGIDKPDVRVVVHYDLPSSLEEYYQEAGRAGRDGLEAYAVVITSKHDKATLTRRVTESFPDKEFMRRVYELAGNFLNVAVGEGYNQVYEFNFNLFCHTFDLPPVPTQNALALLTRSGYIEYVEETTSRSRLMVIMRKEELYSLDLDATTEEVFQYVLRNYTGLFADYVYINEVMIAHDLRLSSEAVYQSLLFLTRLHAIHYIPRKTTPYIIYTTSRELPKHLIIPLEVYERQRERMEHRVNAMKQFAFGTSGCRVNTMLRYFGEKPDCTCGKCDICRTAKKSDLRKFDKEVVIESVMYLTSHPEGRTLKDIIAQTGHSQDKVIEIVRELADTGKLKLEGDKIFNIVNRC